MSKNQTKSPAGKKKVAPKKIIYNYQNFAVRPKPIDHFELLPLDTEKKKS